MAASLIDLGSSAMTVAYFEREGYYAKNDRRHRQASFWHGEGAAALGLPQHVSPRTFERVLAGYVPGTEIRLGRPRDGEYQHRPGLDLTLSAPKSVSLEALLYGNRRVLGAHDAAVRSTLDWVEAELLQTRGYDPATGQRPRVAADGLVAAGFRHLTSRNQDPQLHTHCVLANMTRNRAGEWRSVEPTEIRRNVKLIGEGEGAKFDDPARARLSHATGERDRVREAVDALGAEVQGLRSRALMELGRRVVRQGLDAHCDPVDLPVWLSLRDRAEALRGEASLTADARQAVDQVLARDARVKAEIAPVTAFLEEGARHPNRRVALDEEGRGPSPDAIPAWRERSRDLRETALSLLGDPPKEV